MRSDDVERLLLVEDEYLIALATRKDLNEKGYDVVHAASGEDAVRISRLDESIDLILMDVNLGRGISGPEAAAVILEERRIPVVFISSCRKEELLEKTRQINHYGCTTKDADIENLDSIIRAAINRFKESADTLKLQEGERKC